MGSHRLTRCSAVLAGLLLAASSLAQLAPRGLSARASSTGMASAPESPRFGLIDLSYVRVAAFEFTPYNGGSWRGNGGLTRYPTEDIFLVTGLHLPGGSELDSLEFDFCDDNAGQDLLFQLFDCDTGGFGCVSLADLFSEGVAGCGSKSVSGLGHLVNNADRFLTFQVTFGAMDGSQAMIGVRAGYRLQVSPAPATATFDDVPTNHPYFQFIEALAVAGITAGCNASPPRYCPDREITRGEMAVYMAKALGLHWAGY